MRELITRWCETNQLSFEDAAMLLTEYLSYSNRVPTQEEMQAILMAGQHLFPINWDFIVSQVAAHHGLQLLLVYSKPDQAGNRTLMYRRVY